VAAPAGSTEGAATATTDTGDTADTGTSESQGNEEPDADDALDARVAAEESVDPESGTADFGSAYNSEFSDDDEFEDDYDTGADVDDGHMKPMEKVGRKTPRRDRPPIQQCLRRGQEVIVQVTKEGIGTKGPTLTSYVSCPGRYLVMMPGMAQMKKAMANTNPPTRHLAAIWPPD